VTLRLDHSLKRILVVERKFDPSWGDSDPAKILRFYRFALFFFPPFLIMHVDDFCYRSTR
jgi:hypothetical protein